MAARARGDTDVKAPKAKSDAYTGMLGISLFVLLVGCLLLFLDMQRYPKSAPPAVSRSDAAVGQDQAPPQPNQPANKPPVNQPQKPADKK